MTIRWDEFLLVIISSLIAASLLVTLFSLALRFGVGERPWSKPLSITMYALCGVLVATGIFLIVPALHSAVLG